MADAETEVSDQFNFEESGLRVIFQGGEAIWALRFPNSRSYQDFHNLYNDKLFENTFGVENDPANREKVRAPCLLILLLDLMNIQRFFLPKVIFL